VKDRAPSSGRFAGVRSLPSSKSCNR
jgi:hypothetical protein